MSKWVSEEVWRSAIALQLEQLREAEEPDYILFHRGVPDEHHTMQHRRRLRARLARIVAAGAPDWAYPELKDAAQEAR